MLFLFVEWKKNTLTFRYLSLFRSWINIWIRTIIGVSTITMGFRNCRKMCRMHSYTLIWNYEKKNKQFISNLDKMKIELGSIWVKIKIKPLSIWEKIMKNIMPWSNLIEDEGDNLISQLCKYWRWSLISMISANMDAT